MNEIIARPRRRDAVKMDAVFDFFHRRARMLTGDDMDFDSLFAARPCARPKTWGEMPPTILGGYSQVSIMTRVVVMVSPLKKPTSPQPSPSERRGSRKGQPSPLNLRLSEGEGGGLARRMRYFLLRLVRPMPNIGAVVHVVERNVFDRRHRRGRGPA